MLFIAASGVRWMGPRGAIRVMWGERRWIAARGAVGICFGGAIRGREQRANQELGIRQLEDC